MVGEMVLKLVVSRENGSAPELILSASSFALSYVKLPEMDALPSETMVLSIQMEICPLDWYSSEVAS